MAGSITLEIEGRSYGIAPYKIAELRKAAPHVDRMNELVRKAKDLNAENEKLVAEGKDPRTPPFESAMELLHETCEIIAVGLVKIDPQMTAEWLEERVDLTYQAALQAGVSAVMRSSGLASKGEATALSTLPAEEGADEASRSNSEELSPS